MVAFACPSSAEFQQLLPKKAEEMGYDVRGALASKGRWKRTMEVDGSLGRDLGGAVV